MTEEKVECESKMEEGTSNLSCCDRIVNSGEPHVTFHDGSMYTGAVYKAGDFLNEASAPRSGFSVAALNYSSPAATTPKVMSSSVVGAYPSTYSLGGQPSTYSLGGQSVPYYSTTTTPGSSSYIPQNIYSAPASTPNFPMNVQTTAAPLSSRATSQYPTYTTKYPG